MSRRHLANACPWKSIRDVGIWDTFIKKIFTTFRDMGIQGFLISRNFR